MEALIIEKTGDTPNVVLDAAVNKFEFSGKSLPEDVMAFYQPILDWIESYAKDPNDETDFVFKLDYFNTASSKIIMDIMLLLEEMNENGKTVKVSWYYREDDEDMEEAGEEYADMIEVPFEQYPV